MRAGGPVAIVALLVALIPQPASAVCEAVPLPVGSVSVCADAAPPAAVGGTGRASGSVVAATPAVSAGGSVSGTSLLLGTRGGAFVGTPVAGAGVGAVSAQWPGAYTLYGTGARVQILEARLTAGALVFQWKDQQTIGNAFVTAATPAGTASAGVLCVETRQGEPCERLGATAGASAPLLGRSWSATAARGSGPGKYVVCVGGYVGPLEGCRNVPT